MNNTNENRHRKGMRLAILGTSIALTATLTACGYLPTSGKGLTKDYAPTDGDAAVCYEDAYGSASADSAYCYPLPYDYNTEEYAAIKAGQGTAGTAASSAVGGSAGTAKTAGKAVKEGKDVGTLAVNFVKNHSHVLLIVGGVLMVVLLVAGSISS